jgi:hypothetical protein
MTWWPGWNSIEGTGGWAHFWFWFGMWCFLWLGISEVIAFVYGLRKDDLIVAAQQTTAVQAKKTQDALQEQLSAADKKVANLQDQLGKTAAQVADDHSLKNRVRSLFASIDPSILRQIDSGFFDLTIRMQPPDIEQLQRLLAEPGGADIATIEGFGRSWAFTVLSNGTLGPSAPVPQQVEVIVRATKALAN